MTQEPIKVAPVKATAFTLELPAAPSKLRQWLVDVATRKDMYQEGQMQALSDAEVVEVLRSGLKYLQQREEARITEQRGYLLNRFGTVLVGLDAAQPAEGDIIIVERQDGVRDQCLVEGGSAWLYRNGNKGVKFCAVSRIAKWRRCELPEQPVTTEGPKDFVMDALERGRALAGNGAGLAVKPGTGRAESKVKRV